MNEIEKLKNEFQELQNLESTVGLNEAQQSRLAELPSLIEQAEKTAADEANKKELQTALAQKDHWREKAEKAELDRKTLQDKLDGKQPESVDSLELIKLGKKLQDYSDEEIDFATTHAHSKSPEEILKTLDDPMVQLAIQAKREQDAKAKAALKPTGTPGDEQPAKSLDDILSGGSMAEKEKKLIELGLYIPPKGKPDRTNIGTQR